MTVRAGNVYSMHVAFLSLNGADERGWRNKKPECVILRKRESKLGTIKNDTCAEINSQKVYFTKHRGF
jgi:hypothetical protein